MAVLCGVQERRNDHIATYSANQSDRDMEFEPNTQLAWWEPDTGDALKGKALEKRGQRQNGPQETPLSILTLEGESWEWADELLDLSRTLWEIQTSHQMPP